MRTSKRIGPVTVRTSSRGGVGLSVGSKGTRISTSTRKGGGKVASGCAGIVVVFIILAVILAMCSPKDEKNDPAETEALSAVETLAPETETVSRSLPTEAEEPEILPIEETPPEPASSVTEEPVIEEPAAPVEEPAAVPVEQAPADPEVWIANTNTKKLHYTWCQYAADIKEENKMWVTEPDKMLEWGYTWCTRCHG